ncbi:MAG: arginine--tRNA ligase [Fidelibacterota bacterium]|nr:MAG: arginine--tRNA ligase [Candidatus Neomarinimicrobiota bacterium]
MIPRLRTQLAKALEEMGIEPDYIQLDRPRQAGHGDLATNVPLVCARQAAKPPLAVAEELKARLSLDGRIITRVEVAAPGFLNFFLADDYLRQHLLTVLEQGKDYGKSTIGGGRRALVEFVSANPTGPLTVGHGRGAILGDTVSNILSWNGYQVDREYYYNDAGRQMRLLGESVQARYLELLGRDAGLPEGGYEGEYIRDIARTMVEKDGDALVDETDTAPFTTAAEEAIFQDINSVLDRLGVTFDNYFNEHSLYESGALDDVVSALEKKDLVYRKDGATWLKATALDRPEDRVLIKSSGEPTYRLPDIAYHADKLQRGYDLAVDIFGADHQDTYPDVLAGVQGLGYDTGNIRVLIHQFVTLVHGGQQVKMSTRKATFVTLEELIAEVGRDVVRYFFVMRGMDSHLQFDLDLARKTSDENPVYYLQYAHARMVNIGKRAEAFGYRLEPDSAPLQLLALPEARTLMHLLWWFPEVVQQVHRSLEPQTMANFLQELATAYHRYYTVARVVTDDRELSAARLVITEACRRTLANGLAILGITAPERM